MAIPDTKQTILVVEDEADLVIIIKFRLQANGYTVITVGDGIEALKKVEEIKPDLIILDINLPKMSGIEFYRKISTSYGRSKYPVLVLTARTNLEQLFKDIEADGFITKPFEIDKLINEAERIMSGRSNPTIFLVDYKEAPHVREIASILQSERYNILYPDSLADIKEKAKEEKPDFIIMEYMQKEMAGESFIKMIKNDPFLNGIPLIVYSYSGFKVYEQKSIQAGADAYLGKPDTYGTFLKVIKNLQVKKRRPS